MQKLTIIAIMFFISCGNSKNEIVEQIKMYRDSVGIMKASVVALEIEDRKKYEEIFFTNDEPDRNKIKDEKLIKMYSDYQAKIEDKKWTFNQKKANYQGVIDSLELELKKY